MKRSCHERLLIRWAASTTAPGRSAGVLVVLTVVSHYGAPGADPGLCIGPTATGDRAAQVAGASGRRRR